jgi:hypothetical protein
MVPQATEIKMRFGFDSMSRPFEKKQSNAVDNRRAWDVKDKRQAKCASG